MSLIRAEIWCAAYVRRNNQLGHICVMAKKGDPIAGQIWIEVDHLDGTASLFSPAPALMRLDDQPDWVFQCRFDRQPVEKINQRISQEEQFDPDFWLIILESPKGDHSLSLVSA
ncbi:hypothetical protein MNBD_ALPHA12-228 [hydrothermal vent metagenome]|uniref:DUF1491 family protein n=1 Tax=hydrothermal vent metagenome TaxID=652676 RepID=A0A3B0TGI1_9ZZZZ